MNSSLTTQRTKYEFIENLNRVDFRAIAYKLLHPEDGEAWSEEQATQAIEKYRKLLILYYLYPNRIIVPSKTIDRVWHYHILDTAKYQEDCQNTFGYFLHHFPYFGVRDESDRQNLEDAFAETQNLWWKHFGVEM